MIAKYKYFSYVCVFLTATLLFGSCDRSKEPDSDPRTAFVGDYTFVSTGNIDLYAGVVKVISVPMDTDGELSISRADKENAVWIVAQEDSIMAYISGNRLFMDPMSEQMTFGKMVIDLSFTYKNGELVDDVLTLITEVDATANYEQYSLAGHGQVEVVATKKNAK